MDYYNLKSSETFLVSLKAFIVNKEKLLILKFPQQQGEDWEGKWCLPGGLLEMDENIESGLTREVKEETGLKIKIGYIFSVADFRYDSFIFKDGRKLRVRFIEIGFICKYTGGKVVISDEHSDYKWVGKTELKNLDFTPDSKKLVEDFYEK